MTGSGISVRYDERITGAAARARVLADIGEERYWQIARWGDQSTLPDGVGGSRSATDLAAARELKVTAAERGLLTWAHILGEEVAEALAAPNLAALRRELIQVAAVAVQWVEALDERTR